MTKILKYFDNEYQFFFKKKLSAFKIIEVTYTWLLPRRSAAKLVFVRQLFEICPRRTTFIYLFIGQNKTMLIVTRYA